MERLFLNEITKREQSCLAVEMSVDIHLQIFFWKGNVKLHIEMRTIISKMLMKITDFSLTHSKIYIKFKTCMWNFRQEYTDNIITLGLKREYMLLLSRR